VLNKAMQSGLQELVEGNQYGRCPQTVEERWLEASLVFRNQ